MEFIEYDTDWNSEAYNTVAGQNSNNTVRITNEFMQSVDYENVYITGDVTPEWTAASSAPGAPRRMALRRHGASPLRWLERVGVLSQVSPWGSTRRPIWPP